MESSQLILPVSCSIETTDHYRLPAGVDLLLWSLQRQLYSEDTSVEKLKTIYELYGFGKSTFENNKSLNQIMIAFENLTDKHSISGLQIVQHDFGCPFYVNFDVDGKHMEITVKYGSTGITVNLGSDVRQVENQLTALTECIDQIITDASH